MAATDLGKVGIVMKGTWSSSAAYEVLDAVTYNNGLYIAKQAVPANTLPTNTTYWQVAIENPISAVEYSSLGDATLDENSSVRVGNTVYLVLKLSAASPISSARRMGRIAADKPSTTIPFVAAGSLGSSFATVTVTGALEADTGNIYVGYNGTTFDKLLLVLTYYIN